MGTAKFVKEMDDFTGKAALYRLSPPLVGPEWWTEEGEQPETWEFVIVSATLVLGDPETYIFPADESGAVLNWRELPGSLKGTLLHEDALRGAGYEIEEA